MTDHAAREGVHVVQAPPPHLADDEAITPELYLSVVAHALTHYDLVVVDTQIIEAVDRTGMVNRFVVPLLRAGARGLAITDSSSAGISFLHGPQLACQRLITIGPRSVDRSTSGPPPRQGSVTSGRPPSTGSPATAPSSSATSSCSS